MAAKVRRLDAKRRAAAYGAVDGSPDSVDVGGSPPNDSAGKDKGGPRPQAAQARYEFDQRAQGACTWCREPFGYPGTGGGRAEGDAALCRRCCAAKAKAQADVGAGAALRRELAAKRDAKATAKAAAECAAAERAAAVRAAGADMDTQTLAARWRALYGDDGAEVGGSPPKGAGDDAAADVDAFAATAPGVDDYQRALVDAYRDGGAA